MFRHRILLIVAAAVVAGSLAEQPAAQAAPSTSAAHTPPPVAAIQPSGQLSVSVLRNMQRGVRATPFTVAGNLTNYQTGKCIGISTGLAGDWNCTANGDQVWHWAYLFQDSNGIWWSRLINGNGKCLAVNGGSTDAGARILGFDCVGSADQNWLYLTNGTNNLVNYKGYYSTAHPGYGNCVVGVNGGSNDNGAALILWWSDGTLNQLWNFSQVR